MKKKLLTAALCLAVSFALSACGGNGADGTTAGKTDTATEGASQAAGSNTVVVAMGSEFPPWTQGMYMRSIRLSLSMPVTRTCLSSTAMTARRSLVWPIPMNFQRTVSH